MQKYLKVFMLFLPILLSACVIENVQSPGPYYDDDYYADQVDGRPYYHHHRHHRRYRPDYYGQKTPVLVPVPVNPRYHGDPRYYRDQRWGRPQVNRNGDTGRNIDRNNMDPRYSSAQTKNGNVNVPVNPQNADRNRYRASQNIQQAQDENKEDDKKTAAQKQLEEMEKAHASRSTVRVDNNPRFRAGISGGGF